MTIYRRTLSGPLIRAIRALLLLSPRKKHLSAHKYLGCEEKGKDAMNRRCRETGGAPSETLPPGRPLGTGTGRPAVAPGRGRRADRR